MGNLDSAIQDYYRKIQDLQRAGGKTEGQLRKAFERLLDDTGEAYGMLVLAEVTEEAEKAKEAKGQAKTLNKAKAKNIRYDGKISRKGSPIAHGYWEAKDTNDSLLHEVIRKREAGYKFFNILFEDTRRFILFQDSEQVLEGDLQNEAELAKGLELFYGYRNTQEEHFFQALENFKTAIPALAGDLSAEIERLSRENQDFQTGCQEILKSFQKHNHSILIKDVYEFIVQHTLTIDLFQTIFQAQDFEKFNPIAELLEKLVFKALHRQKQDIYDKSHALLKSLEAVILQGFTTPSDKQQILIAVYEEFFKAYNPKKADTHGIVYTPREVVDFMVASCDELMHQHFCKRISSKGVRILDPCTGTGTFVCGLLRYIPQQYLELKFGEIYAIEVDLMAYYMAQLNIEDCYREQMGHQSIERSYQKLALADSLEIGSLHKDAQEDLFTSYANVTEQNAKLVAELQSSDYLLILGNPPYNNAQNNENENNRNKRYEYLDKRSRNTYTLLSNAQKSQTTDMYIRFLRWASDKLLHQHTGEEGEAAKAAKQGDFAINSKGAMLSFITNRSYIDKLFTDGIRKTWAEEWDHVYVVDLGGDLRSQPKHPTSGKLKGNIFNIQTGVAICCLVRGEKAKPKAKAEIHYRSVDDYIGGKEKLAWLAEMKHICHMQDKGLLERILPDEKGNWLRQGERDFGDYVSMGNKESKAGKESTEPAIFQLYSNGAKTNRDDWVYSHSAEELASKMQVFIERYEAKRLAFWGREDDSEAEQAKKEKKREALLKRNDKNILQSDQQALQEWLGEDIKWSRDLRDRHFIRNHKFKYNSSNIIISLYRPFVKKYFYYEYNTVSDVMTQNHVDIFGANGRLLNMCIAVPGLGNRKDWGICAVNSIPAFDWAFEKIQIFPRYRYAMHSYTDLEQGKIPEKIDNISDEALRYFAEGLEKIKIAEHPDKDQIFAYCYGLLHTESYRKKYADNLRQELPRIPILPEFWHIAKVGQKLLDLHLSWDTDQCPKKYYKRQEKGKTERPEKNPTTIKYSPSSVKDKETKAYTGKIAISNALSLTDIPTQAWDYSLGGRSAIDWVLEFYKESKNTYKDPALVALVAEGKLPPYRLADYEEQLLDTLERVINISCAHVELVGSLGGSGG